jgi:hypothetical protein
MTFPFAKITSAKILTAATAGAVMLITGLIAPSGAALAASKEKDGTLRVVRIDDGKHRHHRLRDRIISSGYADGNGAYVYTEPKTVISAGQYVGRDPDRRLRGQMLIDFNRGVTSPGGR